MTRTSTAHRGEKDDNGFTAKGRVIKAFLANHDVTPEEAFRQAGLVDHKLISVKGWLRNTRRLWDDGLERDGDITIPKEVQEMWRNALRLKKSK
jgi:hypothetical protein